MKTAVAEKFANVQLALEEELVERQREIHGALLALATNSHVFFLGPPGTAKSFLVDRLCARIGGIDLFSILMGNFTGPEDMFGPLDAAGLRESRYRRLTEGYLPSADIAFLDEAWKANDSILNALLKLFNERQFRNDGAMVPVPLKTAFLASNELPENETLKAIYDRILLRYELPAHLEPANMEKMLQLEFSEPTIMLTAEDIAQAYSEVISTPVNERVYTVLAMIEVELRGKNIEVSPRRVRGALRLLQGQAWLVGDSEVTTSHLEILCNVFWEQPENIIDIEKIINDKLNPRQNEIRKLVDDVNSLIDDLDSALNEDDENRAQSKAFDSHSKISDAFSSLKSILEDPEVSPQMRGTTTKVKTRLQEKAVKVLTDIFHLAPEEIEKSIGDSSSAKKGKK